MVVARHGLTGEPAGLLFCGEPRAGQPAAGAGRRAGIGLCPLEELAEWILEGRIEHALHLAAIHLAILHNKLPRP